MAFLLLGVTPYVNSIGGTGWVQNVATGFYAFASASGSIFFALNFGDDGGAPITAWVFRACIIQGMQQAYVVVLWYWGTQISRINSAGSEKLSLLQTNPGVLTGVAILIAVIMCAVGWSLYAGLPKYYRQNPGQIPAFYKSLLRRKIIVVSPLSPIGPTKRTLTQFSGSSTMSLSRTTGFQRHMVGTGSTCGPANTFLPGLLASW